MIIQNQVFDIRDRNGITGFIVTIREDGVEIDTVNGLPLSDFINSLQELLTILKGEYYV